jgi:hypothetical protein
VAEVAARDELALRVAGEPAGAGAEQLLDLVGADPVVLRVVQGREQDVELGERVGELEGAGQPEVDVGGVAPGGDALVEGSAVAATASRAARTALDDVRAAAAAQDRHVDLERDGRARQLRAGVAAARHRGPEDAAEGDGEHREAA